MPETNPNEVWQVDVNGTVYDAAFSELPEWIDGGSLMPGDKVRKGNLRWIEARRVPSLLPFFNAKEQGLPMPVVVTTTDAQDSSPEVTDHQPDQPSVVADPIVPSIDLSPADTVSRPAKEFNLNECVMHAGVATVYLCDGCANGFCKACPNSYGGSVKVCPLCGALCRSAEEVRATQQKMQQQTFAVDQGFGIADFFAALGHPFNFKVSLFFGAFLYMLFTLGKGAGAMGGIYMVVGGIFSGMAANALSFGVLSHTIDNFVQGKFDENFMPEFENFEYWEDVVHPFFLSIAAYISSFAPFLLTLAIGFYLVTSAVTNQIDSYKSDLEKIPGTNVYNGRELVDQTGDVKDVLKDVDQRQRDRFDPASQMLDEDAANTAPTPFVDEETREQEELWAMATESRKQSLESAIGKSPETQAREEAEMFEAFLGLAAPLVVIGFITFTWGLIFFPAACAVAGYTKSFVATINPMIALDTMKRLGTDYLKILAMGFVLMIASLLVGGILALIFAPLDLPAFGNLPATAIGAFFTFYLIAVFSCVLGYALFKKADKLGLTR